MSAGEFASDFADMMPHVVRISHWLGTFDRYGEPQRGDAVETQCLIEEKVRIVKDMKGVDRVSNSTVYVLGGPVNPNDSIVMPPEFTGPAQPAVLAISNLSDEDGFDHAELYL